MPITYGLPTIETWEASDLGEIALGGCCLSDDDPEWECRSCHHRFHGLWRLGHDLRLLVRNYQGRREDMLKAEKALKKCVDRLAAADPGDETCRSLFHQQRAAFEVWIDTVQAFEASVGDFDLAMQTRTAPPHAGS